MVTNAAAGVKDHFSGTASPTVRLSRIFWFSESDEIRIAAGGIRRAFEQHIGERK